MRVVCIENNKVPFTVVKADLTIGKIYNASDDEDIKIVMPSCYLIVNDKGQNTFYSKHLFVTLKEHRISKLERVLKNV